MQVALRYEQVSQFRQEVDFRWDLITGWNLTN